MNTVMTSRSDALIREVFDHATLMREFGTANIALERDRAILQTYLIADGTRRRISPRLWEQMNSLDPVVMREAWLEVREMLLEMTIVQRGVAELGVYVFWA